MGDPRIVFVSREVYPFDSAGLGNYVLFTAAALADVAEVTIVTSALHEPRYRELAAAGDARLPDGVRFEFVPEPRADEAADWYGVLHLWSARAHAALVRLYPDGGPDLVEFPGLHRRGMRRGAVGADPRPPAPQHARLRPRVHHVGDVRGARRPSARRPRCPPSARGRALRPAPRAPVPVARRRRARRLPRLLRRGRGRASHPNPPHGRLRPGARRRAAGGRRAALSLRRAARAPQGGSEPDSRRDRAAGRQLVAHARGRRHSDGAARALDARPARADDRRRPADQAARPGPARAPAEPVRGRPRLRLAVAVGVLAEHRPRGVRAEPPGPRDAGRRAPGDGRAAAQRMAGGRHQRRRAARPHGADHGRPRRAGRDGRCGGAPAKLRAADRSGARARGIRRALPRVARPATAGAEAPGGFAAGLGRRPVLPDGSLRRGDDRVDRRADPLADRDDRRRRRLEARGGRPRARLDGRAVSALGRDAGELGARSGAQPRHPAEPRPVRATARPRRRDPAALRRALRRGPRGAPRARLRDRVERVRGRTRAAPRRGGLPAAREPGRVAGAREPRGLGDGPLSPPPVRARPALQPRPDQLRGLAHVPRAARGRTARPRDPRDAAPLPGAPPVRCCVRSRAPGTSA